MKKKEHSQLGSVKLIGSNEDLPMWSVIKYIEDTCNNYNKVLLLIKICEHLQFGGNDQELWIAKKSMSLFPAKSIEESSAFKKENYIKLTIKDDRPEFFWHIITNYVRPMVFSKNEDEFTPLVDFVDEDAIRISSFSYNSPPIIDIAGALGTLINLAYAGEKNNREEEDHIARQLGEAANNYRQIAFASQVINDPRTPEGIKIYANNALLEIMLKQEVLNKKLGVRVDRIDRSV